MAGQSDFAPALKLVDESLEHLRPWETWVAQHDAESTCRLLAASEAKWATGELYKYAVAGYSAPRGMCQSYRGPGPRAAALGTGCTPPASVSRCRSGDTGRTR
ncbi:hypothetical protein [Streptomyces venezuelae]|uniref:hypothetical protein n=1 Tax=Streptomyces venezuelae TaxID=54571 RepID=UPI0034125B32